MSDTIYLHTTAARRAHTKEKKRANMREVASWVYIGILTEAKMNLEKEKGAKTS